MALANTLPAEALSALVEASAAINAAQGLDETLAAIARAAATVMKAEAASVIMLDPARGKQVFRAAYGGGAAGLVGVEYDEGVGISGAVLASGRPTIVNEVGQEKSHFKQIDARSGFRTRSLMAAPLVHQGRKLGVVEIMNPVAGDTFDAPSLALCEVFANLAAIAATNAGYFDQLARENQALKRSLAADLELVGPSPAMRDVRDLVLQVARTRATVLLLGETGTGKELAARMIHAASPRAERPFVAVNCAALPETLMESELFGHEAGAFTGATSRRAGRFELAEGGTILLDEIAEMNPNVQAKLLRVLEQKQITRVGGSAPLSCDVRIVAATNRDLAKEIQAGRFREDLFYRLNVFPIEMPPLRRRREDIPALAAYLLKQVSVDMKIPAPTVSEEAMATLLRYEFPGNVRELRNILERAALLGAGTEGPGVIRPQHLPRTIAGEPAEAPAAGGSALAAHEKALLVNALRENGWNQTRTAAKLGITRDNLRYRMRKHGIRPPKQE